MPPFLSLPSKIVSAAWHYRSTLSTEQLILWVVAIFSVFYNVLFWQQALAGYDLLAVQTWFTFATMFLVMTCLNFLVFITLSFRTLVKPLLTLLFLIAAFVSYLTSYYGTYFDTSVLDNVLQTDTNEAKELLTAGLLIHLAIFFGLPSVIIWRVHIIPSTCARFVPTCTTADLAKCSRDAITNSYDNAILYTDTVLDQVIDTLKRQDDYAAAMIYLSDHGESLGEKGFYLHGIPYAIAPDEQTHVPMVWWLSSAFSQQQGFDTDCLRQVSDQAASHDNLFHSVLGLLDVATNVYRRADDISQTCRQPPAAKRVSDR